MNVCKESENLIFLGSEFQSLGAAMAKARSPTVRRLELVMGLRRLAVEERRLREGLCGCKRSVR